MKMKIIKISENDEENLDELNDIKIGDLVETCSCMPGFVIWINPRDPNEIEIQELDRIGIYSPGRGGLHDRLNCGINKISTEKAAYMCALGRNRVEELWQDKNFDWSNIDAWRKELEKISIK